MWSFYNNLISKTHSAFSKKKFKLDGKNSKLYEDPEILA